MKNLKKVLALVLALATVMGLGVTASAKEYTDAKDITYTEAVEVMSAIDILSGNPDGSFAPTKNLTRVQAAKMVAFLLNSGKDVNDLYAGANTFTDCYSSWGKGYIAYAQQAGVVSGVGNGKFNPNGTLTGVQLAKMMLVSLGYDAIIEKYQGDDGWALNIISDATDAGLLKGLDSTNLYNPITREQASQMMFNALQATMVKYTNKGTNIDMGNGIVINTSASAATDVTNEDVAGDSYNNNADGKTQLVEKYFSDLKKVSDTENGATGYTWQIKGEDVSSFYSSEETLGTSTDGTTIAKLTTAKGNTGYDSKKFIAELDGTVTHVVNGTNAAATATGENAYFVDGNVLKYGTNSSSAAVDLTGVTVKLVDTDDNGKVNKVFYEIATFAQVTGVTTRNETSTKGAYTQYTLSNGQGSFKVYSTQVNKDNDVDEAVVYDGIAKDDYVLVMKMATGTPVITKADVVTGKLTAKSSDNKYTIDGTVYQTSGIKGGTLTALTTPVFNTEYAYYLDAAGYIVHAEPVDETVTTQYGLVVGYQYTAANALTGTAESSKVQLMLEDGTVGVYDTATNKGKIEDLSSTFMNSKHAILVKYAMNSSNVITTLTTVGTEVTVDGSDIAASAAKATKLETSDGVYKYVTTSTKLIYMDSSKAYNADTNTPAVATGYKSLEALSNSDKYFYVTNSDNSTLIDVIFVQKTSQGISSNAEYVYVVDTKYSTSVDADNNELHTFNVYKNGELTTLVTDDATDVTGAGLYSYTEKDGVVTFTAVSNNTPGANAATKWTSGVVTVLQDTYFATASQVIETNADTLFYEVTSDDMVQADMSLSDAVNVNILFTQQNADGVATVVYYSVTDKT